MYEITIRHATVMDIPVLLRQRRMMWWDMGERNEAVLDSINRAASEYFAKAVADRSYLGFLAVDKTGTVIGGGGIVISPWPGIPGQRKPQRAMILNVYVDREHRRRGVARALMKEMIACCRENGFTKVGLHASDQGRPLYQQLGFEPTNEMQLALE